MRLDQNHSKPNWTRSASVFLEMIDPDVETVWNWSGTDPDISKTGSANQQVQFWIRLDPLLTSSRMILCKQKAYPVQFFRLDLFVTGPVYMQT